LPPVASALPATARPRTPFGLRIPQWPWSTCLRRWGGRHLPTFSDRKYVFRGAFDDERTRMWQAARKRARSIKRMEVL